MRCADPTAVGSASLIGWSKVRDGTRLADFAMPPMPAEAHPGRLGTIRSCEFAAYINESNTFPILSERCYFVTALVPYFAGVSLAAHSDPLKRPGYLKRCLASLVGFADRIVIETEKSYGCDPVFLPANMFRHWQGRVGSGFVFCTEADQVLHWSEEALGCVRGDDYLVPFRWERGFKIDGGFGGGFLCSTELFAKVEFRDEPFSSVEHSMLFDIDRVGNHNQVESFWVDHLSGQEVR